MSKLKHELFERVNLNDPKSAIELYVGMGSIIMLSLSVIHAGYATFRPGLIEENFKEMQNTIIGLGAISAALYTLKKIIRCLREIQWWHERKK
ncbi:hypothetical protein HYV80_05195 [Candidatus Woesearchaeota archaeon]|nr:hypothetical protein [Candidatus Woesearchaeota archaeon]